jgi:hypothetical protein
MKQPKEPVRSEEKSKINSLNLAREQNKKRILPIYKKDPIIFFLKKAKF